MIGYFQAACYQGPSTAYHGLSVLFLLTAESNPVVWVKHTWLMRSSSTFLALASQASMNICTQVFVWTYICISLGSRLEWNARSHGNARFPFLRTCQAVSPSS